MTRLAQHARMIAQPSEARSSYVTSRHSYITNAPVWQLRLRGHPVGGYAFVDDLGSYDPTASYASREAADRAGEAWIATGVLPTFQRIAPTAEERAFAIEMAMAQIEQRCAPSIMHSQWEQPE